MERDISQPHGYERARPIAQRDVGPFFLVFIYSVWHILFVVFPQNREPLMPSPQFIKSYFSSFTDDIISQQLLKGEKKDEDKDKEGEAAEVTARSESRAWLPWGQCLALCFCIASKDGWHDCDECTVFWRCYCRPLLCSCNRVWKWTFRSLFPCQSGKTCQPSNFF